MSRLLVVISRDARLEGTLADAQAEHEGARVFYLDGTEVARAQPGEHVAVRRLPAHLAEDPRSTAPRLMIQAAG